MAEKGVSSVIATLLMVVIAISMGGLAYGYVAGIFVSQTSAAFNIISTNQNSVVIKNLGTSVISSLVMSLDGGPGPSWGMRFEQNSQEAEITPEGSQAVGTLATDGTYLYGKSWGPYDGDDQMINKIGTGYYGTVAGRDYGPLTNAVWRSPCSILMATYTTGGLRTATTCRG